MKLITKRQQEQLLANGEEQQMCLGTDSSIDQTPVVKLFTPDRQATWLLSEIDPFDIDIAFGLCDLGLGSPELGTVRLSELKEMKGVVGLGVERDRSFAPEYPLSRYAEIAKAKGCIVA